MTADFARSGQGSRADADRAEAELAVRKNDVLRAEEQTRVASAPRYACGGGVSSGSFNQLWRF